MRWFERVIARLRATLSRDLDRDLRDEHLLHLELLEQEYRDAGMNREEAAMRANREFGNRTLLQERSHALLAFTPLEDLTSDFRYAVRGVRRTAGFTLVAVVSLAVAIGAATAAFRIIDAFWLRKLPVSEPEQLVALSVTQTAAWSRWPYAYYQNWRESAEGTVDLAAASDPEPVTLTVPEQTTTGSVHAALVSGNYFDVLRVPMARGRALSDADDRILEPPVAVISDAAWGRWFGRSDNAIGSTLDLNSVRYEIVGVALSSFMGDWIGRPTDVWLPLSTLPVLTADTSFFSDRWGDGPRRLRVLGRVRPNVTVAAAEARTNLVFQQLVSAKSTAIGEQAPSIKREREQQVALMSAATGYAPERDTHRRPVTIVATMVTLLFIVACVNFANLLLARSKDRSHELSVRLALGASHWRIVRQTIAECSVLSTAAATLGVLLSGWGAAAALNAVALTGQRLAPDVGIDFRVLAFGAMCMGIVLAFGVTTSLWAIRKRDRTLMLRPGATERRRHLFDAGQFLLVGQMTLCAMILVASVLLLRTVMNLRTQDLGFDRNVLLISLSPRDLGGPSSAAAIPLLAEVQERLRALPQVEGVGASGATLLAPGNYWTDTAARLTTETGSSTSDLSWTFASVGDGYFRAMGATVYVGREFAAADVSGPNNVAIVNQTMATFLFGDRDPIGRLIGIDGRPASLRVIGVVSDAKQRSPRDRHLGMVYLPLRQIRNPITVAVRPAPSADGQVTAMVVEQLRAIRPDLTQAVVRSLNDVFEEAIARERVLAGAAAFFGVLVLLIACVGLHAIMSHRVKRRTHEIGVRLAMGATKQRVMRLVLRETIALVLVGLAVGLPLGSLLGHQLRAQLFDISVQDPATLAAVALILLLVTSVATLHTARAASRIEPVSLLRAASL